MESTIEIINGWDVTTSGDTHLRFDLSIDVKLFGFDDILVIVEICDKNEQLVYDHSYSADVEQLTRLGEAIGISKSINDCTVEIYTSSTMDPNYLMSPVNAPSYQCLQSIYRGIESNIFFSQD